MNHPIFNNQKEMFLWIWENRPHESELSGKPLLPFGHYLWYSQFLHVLPKGTYSKWKLYPNNIMLALPDEHKNQEQYEAFNNRKDELRQEYYIEFFNKTYN